jgi:hypothetical protein
MPRRDPALDEAIREIAALLADAYLHLRLPDPEQKEVDSAETESLRVTMAGG